jgi:SAM-dependent methyltransferase
MTNLFNRIFEDNKPVLPYNTFDKRSDYWATFKGDSTDNLDPNQIVNASEGTDNPPIMIPVKQNIIAYFVEDKLSTSTVLDLGCGVGRMNLFYDIGHYDGIDPTPEMVDKAIKLNKDRLNEHTFNTFNGKDLYDQSNDEYDFVFCSTVMLHLKIGTVKNYAKEVWRVLKSNGSFIVNFPNKSDLKLIERIFHQFKTEILDNNYCGTDTVYKFTKIVPELSKSGIYIDYNHNPRSDPQQ